MQLIDLIDAIEEEEDVRYLHEDSTWRKVYKPSRCAGGQQNTFERTYLDIASHQA